MFLLWFNELDSNYVLGIFDKKEDAIRWKHFLITNPGTQHYPDMIYYANQDEFGARFTIEDRQIGLDPNIKIDNLKYVEWLFNNSIK